MFFTIGRVELNYKSFTLISKLIFIKDSFKDCNYINIFKEKCGYIDFSLKNIFKKANRIEKRKVNIK